MSCPPPPPLAPALAIQGGAGAYQSIDDGVISKEDYSQGVLAALRVGYQVLLDGGSAVKAVVEATKAMEDNPVFNSGKGSCLTQAGSIEMDASVMDGRTLDAGAVAGVSTVKNPIALAQVIMTQTPHVLVIGEAAEKMAVKAGLEMATLDYFITEKSARRLQKSPFFRPSLKREIKRGAEFEVDGEDESGNFRDPDDHDTVGAVACDADGNMAYATSTGGITAKMCGRVGDSPIPGQGGYADNCAGAVSCTGDGEAFMKTCLAVRIAKDMEEGMWMSEALERNFSIMQRRLEGYGGAVAIDPQGEVGVYFNTEGMAWAHAKAEVVHHGVLKGEDFVIKWEDFLEQNLKKP